MTAGAVSAVSGARSTRAFRAVARTGYAVNGLLNVVIGLLAISVAVGGAGAGQASQSGAIARLLVLPGGAILVWVIAIGCAGLGLWMLTEAFFDRDADAKERWAHRAKHIGKGAAYLAIAVVAVTTIARGGSGGGGGEESATATLLSTPGGVVLVVAVGLAALGIGGYMIQKGARRRFVEDLDLPSGTAGRATVVLGIVGYVARGVAIAIIGILFVVAAVTADPDEAGGLDDALASLAALPFGTVLLVLIGLGFIAYGLYSVVRARRAKL